MPTPDATLYAFTRSIDPLTGDLRLDGARYVPGAPMAEVALRVLRTPRGSYLPDPTFGLDYAVLTKQTPAVGATLEAALRDALARYTTQGLMTDLGITVEVGRGIARFRVAFVDPRARARLVVPPVGTPPLTVRFG
jgi:hypothetical protein